MPSTIVSTLLSLSVLCAVAGPATAAPASEGKPCRGTLEIGGKTYALQYAVAYPVKVFDADGYSVLFADEAVPVEKLRAALVDGKGSDDQFFFFKPYVTVTFDKSGKVMFCNAYADNHSVSVGGSSLSGVLAVKEATARGKASLVAEPDSTRKSRFDVPAFELPLLVVPPPTTKPVEPKSVKADPTAGEPVEPVEPGGPAAVHSKDLPLPENATEAKYQKLTGQIRCKAPGTVDKVAGEITKKLTDQKWETQGKDLVAKSATLRRKRGEATLTIFVRSVDAQTVAVQVMSTGLGWDEQK